MGSEVEDLSWVAGVSLLEDRMRSDILQFQCHKVNIYLTINLD